MQPLTWLDSDEWLKTLSNTLPLLIWGSAADGGCNYFNHRWLEFTGRTLEESLGNGWARDVHPDDAERVIQSYLRNLEARQKFRLEYRLKYQGGPYKWIVDFGTPVFDPARNFLGYIGGCIDVTTLKGSGMALSWREKYYAALEAETERIGDKIWAAEVAIRDRLEDLTSDPEERACLQDGLKDLQDYKKKKLGLE
jgi:PAS domain S-box-containing protein